MTALEGREKRDQGTETKSSGRPYSAVPSDSIRIRIWALSEYFWSPVDIEKNNFGCYPGGNHVQASSIGIIYVFYYCKIVGIRMKQVEGASSPRPHSLASNSEYSD